MHLSSHFRDNYYAIIDYISYLSFVLPRNKYKGENKNLIYLYFINKVIDVANVLDINIEVKTILRFSLDVASPNVANSCPGTRNGFYFLRAKHVLRDLYLQ